MKLKRDNPEATFIQTLMISLKEYSPRAKTIQTLAVNLKGESFRTGIAQALTMSRDGQILRTAPLRTRDWEGKEVAGDCVHPTASDNEPH